jgi:hypothetical protein
MRRAKYLGMHSPHFRQPVVVRKCPCGLETRKRGQIVGARCWAAASPNLRKEVYNPDPQVAEAAWRSLLDFATSRKPSTAEKS